MTEIKINIELGVNAELKEFVTALFSGAIHSGAIHTAAMPSSQLNTAVAEHMTLPRRRAAKPTTAGAVISATTVEQEPEAPKDAVEQEPQKSAITLPDLRTEVKRLYDGGNHKEELPIIFSQFGVKNVTEMAEDKYRELYNVLTAKSEELGL